MMLKQLPDMSQDIRTKEDAALYAASVMKLLKVSNVEKAIRTAYLMGTKIGFCIGYQCSATPKNNRETK